MKRSSFDLMHMVYKWSRAVRRLSFLLLVAVALYSLPMSAHAAELSDGSWDEPGTSPIMEERGMDIRDIVSPENNDIIYSRGFDHLDYNPFDFIIDPQRLIAQWFAATDESDIAGNATVFFGRADGSFHESSEPVTVINKGSVSMEAVVQVELDQLGGIIISEDCDFASEEAPMICMTVVDSLGNITPLNADGVAELHYVIPAASEEEESVFWFRLAASVNPDAKWDLFAETHPRLVVKWSADGVGSASDNSASDNSASDNSASDNSASDNSASDNSASDNSASDNSASDNSASDNSASDNSASDNSASDNSASDNSASDNSASDNSASDNSASDNSASDNSASDNSASDNSASDNSASDNSASDNSVSENNGTDEEGEGDEGEAGEGEEAEEGEEEEGDDDGDDSVSDDTVSDNAVSDNDASDEEDEGDDPADDDASEEEGSGSESASGNSGSGNAGSGNGGDAGENGGAEGVPATGGSADGGEGMSGDAPVSQDGPH